MQAKVKKAAETAISTPWAAPAALRAVASQPWFAAAEVGVFVGSIIVYIWWLEPWESPPLDAAFWIFILALPLAFHLAHGDDFRRVGLRFDNLRASAGEVVPATAAATALLVAAGWALGSLDLPDDLLLRLAGYPAWALLQQYALQGVVLLRLLDAGADRRAPAAAAGLFALVHLPNPGLTIMTFASGWLWCTLFRRQPNLLVLALSHGWLATFAQAALPAVLDGRLRIGPGYLDLIGL